MLPEETCPYERPLPLRDPPRLIKLDQDSSCNCRDGGRAWYDPEGPTVVKQCMVYTLLEAFAVDIELQPCPRCPPSSRKHIGPDPRNLGLFNFNNHRLFTHELLTDYTSAFTSSETPIDAWVRHTSRRYQQSGSDFIGREVLMGAWFSFVRLMTLEPDEPAKKCCPKCGPTPREIIWDGVSIAFGRKQVNNSLQPPTEVCADSPSRPSKPIPHKEWFDDITQRKTLRDWLNKGLDTVIREGDRNERRLLEEALRRHQVFTKLKTWLEKESPDLGQLFNRTVGFGVMKESKWKPRPQYKKLFEVVSHIPFRCLKAY